jgi:hypothetical protein
VQTPNDKTPGGKAGQTAAQQENAGAGRQVRPLNFSDKSRMMLSAPWQISLITSDAGLIAFT